MASADNNLIEPAAGGPPRPADPADEALLTRYMEGRLDIPDRLAVEEMLRGNAAARRRLDALREEEKLIREGLEPVSEPSVRLSDKVIAALHTEERARRQALRARRVRRHVFAVLSAAAMLVLCVWLVSPRDAIGTAVSGTPAALITPNNDRRVLTRDMRVFEGDRIVTAQGQFVRLRLANEAVLDIDEHTRLRVEKSRPAPAFQLEAGRVGVRTQRQEAVIRVPQGTARAAAGALVDVWLPRAADALWPAQLEPSPGRPDTPVGPGTASTPAVVTVISGTACVANETLPGGIAVDSGTRVLLWPKARKAERLDLAGSRVLNTRQGSTWHALDGVSPQDRTVIGLLERPDFADLGRRLSMTGNTPEPVVKAVSQALELLQNAMQTAASRQRAEKLAAAQQALRLAYAPLRAHDEHRVLGRLLEGLAHLERGRALMAVLAADGETAETRNAALAAFDAARVAFEETLKPDPDAPPAQADGSADWARQLAAGPSVTLRELSPANQTNLLAKFNHAVARCWLARAQAPVAGVARPSGSRRDPEDRATVGEDAAGAAAARSAAVDTAKEFEELRSALGRSVEALASRLGEGLVLEAAGDTSGAPVPDARAGVIRNQAVEALEEVLSVPLEGWSGSSRQYGAGIKQAALVALVRTHLGNREPAKARSAADDFSILYPLDASCPAAREIRRLLDDYVLQEGAAALRAGRLQAAVDAYDQWIHARAAGAVGGTPSPAALDPQTAKVRLQLLQALIELKDGARAQHEAAELAGRVPAALKPEADALAAKARALPAPADKPALPQQP